MQLDAADLADFYEAPLGLLTRRIIGRQLRILWPQTKDARLLGYGFAVPYLRAFQLDAERTIAANARVIWYPPRRLADLLRQRVRAVTGVTQLERTPSAPASTQRTKLTDLAGLARDQPRLVPRLACFTAISVVARTTARWAIARGDYSTWLRDESSRAAASLEAEPRGQLS